MIGHKAALSILFAIGTAVVPATADSYANFFDDEQCSVDGGIGVDMWNNGCLNEAGRQSVYLPNYRPTGMPMTWQFCSYTEEDCYAENLDGDPWRFTSTGFCQTLQPDRHKSYKFIREFDNCN